MLVNMNRMVNLNHQHPGAVERRCPDSAYLGSINWRISNFEIVSYVHRIIILLKINHRIQKNLPNQRPARQRPSGA
jgi:hypothetical protein